VKYELKRQFLWCNRAQCVLTIGLVIFIALFYLAGIRPTSARLRAIAARESTQRSDLQLAELRAETLPAAELETERLQRGVEEFDSKLPHHQGLPQLIGDVTQMSHRAMLSKLAWRPEAVLKRNDHFTELPVEFTFQGDFLGVVNFLSQVESMQRVTRLRKLDVQSKDSMDGQVDVQLTMNIYYAEE
jgi:Tfp pilus assembly protein PilO